MSYAPTLSRLESILAHACGFPVSVERRGHLSYAVSATGARDLRPALELIGRYDPVSNVEQGYDPSADRTCARFAVNV